MIRLLQKNKACWYTSEPGILFLRTMIVNPRNRPDTQTGMHTSDPLSTVIFEFHPARIKTFSLPEKESCFFCVQQFICTVELSSAQLRASEFMARRPPLPFHLLRSDKSSPNREPEVSNPSRQLQLLQIISSELICTNWRRRGGRSLRKELRQCVWLVLFKAKL
jgi:hypothetical protein